jgi:hypothetical protein
MYVEHNERELQEFEESLRRAMQRREAPLGLKQRVLARARERRQAQRSRWWMLQRVAASIVLAAACGGYAVYHQHAQEQVEEQRKGEEVRQQVLTAMRITNRALNHVSTRLSADSQ